MKKIVANCETGEVLEVELTAEEIEQLKIDAQESKRIKAEELAKAQARQDILDRLGLTQEEAKILLG